jgi:hypothetical protein
MFYRNDEVTRILDMSDEEDYLNPHDRNEIHSLFRQDRCACMYMHTHIYTIYI